MSCVDVDLYVSNGIGFNQRDFDSQYPQQPWVSNSDLCYSYHSLSTSSILLSSPSTLLARLQNLIAFKVVLVFLTVCGEGLIHFGALDSHVTWNFTALSQLHNEILMHNDCGYVWMSDFWFVIMIFVPVNCIVWPRAASQLNLPALRLLASILRHQDIDLLFVSYPRMLLTISKFPNVGLEHLYYELNLVALRV